jgi:glycosyltransferase involved in cell wall biosynthesis
VRILYLTDNTSVHNRRFLGELLSAGNDVWSWNLSTTRLTEQATGISTVVSTHAIEHGSPPEQYRGLLPALHTVLKDVKPALVHAGPIQTAGYLAALADFHPLLLMSWGSDLLVDADRDAEWKHATELALQKADAFFCDCDTVRKKAHSFRAFSDAQVVQFPWGIKRGIFSPTGPLPAEDFARQPDTTTFIYTRSYTPLYGTDVLLDAFVRARTMNSTLRLLLVGNGTQDPTLRSFIDEHSLHDAAFLAGPQPTEDLPKWFRAADVYISCAKSDGTSISLLEAMATGLPVLVTDIPSNREWVTEPENGWLARAGSAEAVADKMLQAANLTAVQRNHISERNQCVVANRADWDQNFPRLLEMYERLVASNSGGRR